MKCGLQLFGLLHLAQNESSAENVKVQSFEQQCQLYINNAVTLAKTLAYRGYQFTLLTNDKSHVDSILKTTGKTLHTQALTCETSVPSGARFFSAHHKLDVFHYLASLPRDLYTGLIDLDVIAANPAPECLDRIIAVGIPLCYDISDQVIPAYGHTRILADMQLLSGSICEGRWSGGEFICGTADFFAALYEESVAILGRYTEHFMELHHQGDEIITSVALEKLRMERRFYIADAGRIGIIGRYWNCLVQHPQPDFSYFQSCFLLHLPADKKWLADFSNVSENNIHTALSRYRQHRRIMSLTTPARKARQLLQNR